MGSHNVQTLPGSGVWREPQGHDCRTQQDGSNKLVRTTAQTGCQWVWKGKRVQPHCGVTPVTTGCYLGFLLASSSIVLQRFKAKNFNTPASAGVVEGVGGESGVNVTQQYS